MDHILIPDQLNRILLHNGGDHGWAIFGRQISILHPASQYQGPPGGNFINTPLGNCSKNLDSFISKCFFLIYQWNVLALLERLLKISLWHFTQFILPVLFYAILYNIPRFFEFTVAQSPCHGPENPMADNETR